MYIRDVIILFGKARSGKGALADRFEHRHQFLQLGLMNAMYRLYQAAYGVPIEKEEHLRPFLQDVGTNIVRQFDPDFHSRCLIREAKTHIATRFPVPHIDLVINDARTPREGNLGEGRIPNLIKEIIGRPARRIVSCFVRTSSEVQAHIMGEAAYKEFIRSGRVAHVTEPTKESIETDLLVCNSNVGKVFFDNYLHSAEESILAALHQ